MQTGVKRILAQDLRSDDLVCAFFVAGEPIAQPRARHFVRPGQKFVQTVSNPQKHPIVGWKQALRSDGIKAMSGRGPVEHPVHLEVLLVASRPATGGVAAKSRRHLAIPHTKKPDADNTLKAIQDALNKIVWKDDSLISSVWVHKRYTMPNEGPGAHIIVTHDHATEGVLFYP